MNSNQTPGYEKDVVDELTSMLSEELAKSIDAEIIKELFKKENLRKEKIKNILDLLNDDRYSS